MKVVTKKYIPFRSQQEKLSFVSYFYNLVWKNTAAYIFIYLWLKIPNIGLAILAWLKNKRYWCVVTSFYKTKHFWHKNFPEKNLSFLAFLLQRSSSLVWILSLSLFYFTLTLSLIRYKEEPFHKIGKEGAKTSIRPKKVSRKQNCAFWSFNIKLSCFILRFFK